MDKKEEYAKAVCLFLAEQLRIHRLTLARAAEIARKIVAHMNLIDTEYDFLNLVKELSKDFDELVVLEQRVYIGVVQDERKHMETLVKEFVIETLSNDSDLALAIMHDATQDKVKLSDLKQKFPQFNTFLQANYAR